MAGDIFYSQVDENLAHELNARAAAGFFNKSKKSVDFMLSKMTNVEVKAYKGPLLDDNELVESKDGGDNRFAILGGTKTRRESYRASSLKGQDNGFAGGYLTNDRPANRIPPVITLVEVNYGDHSMGLLNNASINVLISDPTADLEDFEKIWFRPGRHITIKVLGNPESIITNGEYKQPDPISTVGPPAPETYGLLTPIRSRTYDQLVEKYGSNAKTREYDDRKMNEVFFSGIITSFTFSYQIDGTVEASIQFKGTSNVYTDITLTLPTKKKEDDTNESTKLENEDVTTFDQYIDNYVNEIIKLNSNQDVPNFEYLITGEPGPIPSIGRADLGVIVGELYTETADVAEGSLIVADSINDIPSTPGPENKLTPQNQYKYITLGLFIKLLNDNIIEKLNVTPKDPKNPPFLLNAEIICNEAVCLGVSYPDLVSADPRNVLLWSGNNDSTTCTYPSSTISLPPAEGSTDPGPSIEPVRVLPNVKGVSPGYQVGDVTFPSRIYLGMEKLEQLIKESEDGTVNTLLKKVSNLIYSHTGGAIKMSLVSDPLAQDKLLYYNSNFIGTNESVKQVGVNPFLIPMSAKDNLDDDSSKLIGSIVIDAKISSKLPGDLQSLAYVLNQGTEISKLKISPFTTYMYADEEQREQLREQYADQHKDAKEELEQAKALLANDDWEDDDNHARLRKTLRKYIQYPTSDITESNVLDSPIYPFDAEITIEGIQGFRYGDVVQLPVLPTRYRTQAVFSIIQVSHTIDSAGVWQTKLKLVMRAKAE